MDWSYTSLTVERIWDVMENWVMVALPMFILMVLLLDRSGIANQPVNALVWQFAWRLCHYRYRYRTATRRHDRHHRGVGRAACTAWTTRHVGAGLRQT